MWYTIFSSNLLGKQRTPDTYEFGAQPASVNLERRPVYEGNFKLKEEKMTTRPWGFPHWRILLAGLLTVNSLALAQSAKQMTGDSGWISTWHDLFWTSTAGTGWANITPPQRNPDKVISAVFFLNASQGWVVLARHDDARDTTFFWIATTADSGVSWSSHRLNIPELYQGNPAPILDENVFLHFSDAQHGILSVSLGGSFLTIDGGETWQKTAVGAPGPLFFANRNDGWQLGESARMDYDGELWVTRDGSRTWQEVVLPSPPDVNTRYDLPTFTDGQHGFLVVHYSGPQFEGVGLFSTADTGRTWKEDHLLRSDYHTIFIAHGGAWVMARVEKNNVLSLKTVSGSAISSGATDTNITSLHSISFVDDVHAWAVASGQLLSTADSGLTWTNITPKPMRPVVPTRSVKTGPLPPPSKH